MESSTTHTTSSFFSFRDAWWANQRVWSSPGSFRSCALGSCPSSGRSISLPCVSLIKLRSARPRAATECVQMRMFGPYGVRHYKAHGWHSVPCCSTPIRRSVTPPSSVLKTTQRASRGGAPRLQHPPVSASEKPSLVVVSSSSCSGKRHTASGESNK